MEKKKPKISIIVAVGENGVIGKNNDLPWSRLPRDMKYFVETTMGKPVITGRKNYESIPEKFRPLVGRDNIVITNQSNYSAAGAVVTNSLEQALNEAMRLTDDEVFIIGGGEIYRQTLYLADKLYVTKVHESFEGDTFFPAINESQWKEIKSQLILADEKHKHSFTFYVYERIR